MCRPEHGWLVYLRDRKDQVTTSLVNILDDYMVCIMILMHSTDFLRLSKHKFCGSLYAPCRLLNYDRIATFIVVLLQIVSIVTC